MASPEFLAAQNVVKRLEIEIESARRYWAVFTESNGRHELERDGLRKSIANTYAAHAFSYIQMSCAINAVMALARITDARGADRMSLDALRGIIGPIQVEIAADALTWYSHLDSNLGSRMATDARDEVAAKLPTLISDIGTLLKSGEAHRIRVLRNEALAHALEPSNLLPTYEDIAFVFRHASELIAVASHLICGRPWDVDSFNEVPATYAKEFWDVVEHGLESMRAKKLI